MGLNAGATLLIGFGNPGRGDDGLGPAFAHRIERQGLPGLRVDIDYQLTVDHASMIASAGTVVFADAALDAAAPFYFRPLEEGTPQTLGSHTVSPQSALALARLLFGAAPRGFVLGLQGAACDEIVEGLSEAARRNLDLAEAFFLRWYAGELSGTNGAITGVS